MASRKRPPVAVKRITRSHSQNPDPASPPQRQPQLRFPSSLASSPHKASPPHKASRPLAPRRNAPPAGSTNDQSIITMGSVPLGANSSTPSKPPAQHPLTSDMMIFLGESLLRKSKDLIAHLGDARDNSELWSLKANILSEDMEQTRNKYLEQDDIFIDPAIGAKISVEKTEAAAALVVDAVYTANLATLLFLCIHLKNSTESKIRTRLLEPLENAFPSSFVPMGAMDSKQANKLAALALSIRRLRTTITIDEGRINGDNTKASLEHITHIFFGVKDDDIQSYLDADEGAPLAFSTLQLDKDLVKKEVLVLAKMVETPHKASNSKQKRLVEQVRFLEGLAQWVRDCCVWDEDGQHNQVQSNDGGSKVDEPVSNYSSDESDSSDESSDDDVTLPPGIAAAAHRDGPPGAFPASGRDTPQDYSDIGLSQMRASGVVARPQPQPLPSTIEEEASFSSDGPLAPDQVGSRKRRSDSINGDDEDDEDDSDEDDEFQTDARGHEPKRSRISTEVPSKSVVSGRPSGRRPLPPGIPSSSRPPARATGHSTQGPPRSRDAADEADAATSADEQLDLDLETIRQQNTEERRTLIKPMQQRIPWTRKDENTLLIAVKCHSACWSVIANVSKFEKDRDQQQVRDKARNLKVNFLLADTALPPGFDCVALGTKEKRKIISMGKNPDRKEDDWDVEADRATNTLYVGDH